MKVKVLAIALVSALLIVASLPVEAGIKFTVWATYYIPKQEPNVREVSLPDVFIKWAHLSPGSFDSEKWYPGPDPDRKHTEGDLTWSWNTLEMPSEEKPIPPDIDFFNSKEAIKSFYKSKKFEVRIKWRDKTATAPVNISWDSLGPWNYQDNYWEVADNPDAVQKRRLHASVPRGIPAAYAAKHNGYLGGKDEAGRVVESDAGIDLSKALADEIGFTQKGHDEVEVELLWVGTEPPPPPISDWPFHQRDLQNSGNNPEALGIRNPKLDEGLTIPGTSAYSQPIVEGKMVYLATMDGKVIASDMERKLCPWFFDTGAEEIKLTPALVDNKLYVLDSNNVLWCLDKRNGNWIWYFDIIDYFGLPDYYWQTSPQIWQNNYVCLTVGPYAVFIYDDIEIASKGPKIAKLAKMPIQAQSEPAEFVATSVISEDGIFYCFDFACNVIAFKIETAGYLWHISEFPGPADEAGLTYLGNPFAIVLAEDVLILKNNWRFDFQDTEPKPGETGFLYAIDTKALS